MKADGRAVTFPAFTTSYVTHSVYSPPSSSACPASLTTHNSPPVRHSASQRLPLQLDGDPPWRPPHIRFPRRRPPPPSAVIAWLTGHDDTTVLSYATTASAGAFVARVLPVRRSIDSVVTKAKRTSAVQVFYLLTPRPYITSMYLAGRI